MRDAALPLYSENGESVRTTFALASYPSPVVLSLSSSTQLSLTMSGTVETTSGSSLAMATKSKS